MSLGPYEGGKIPMIAAEKSMILPQEILMCKDVQSILYYCIGNLPVNVFMKIIIYIHFTHMCISIYIYLYVFIYIPK